MQGVEQEEDILQGVLLVQEEVEQRVLQQELDQLIQVEEEVEDHLEIQLEELEAPADQVS